MTLFEKTKPKPANGRKSELLSTKSETTAFNTAWLKKQTQFHRSVFGVLRKRN